MVNSAGVSVEVQPRERKRLGRTIKDAATMRRTRDILMAHLVLQGVTTTEVGRLFGISSEAVKKRILSASSQHRLLPSDFSWPNQRNAHRPDLVAVSINHLKNSGLTTSDISWILDISESTVRRA